MDKEILQRLLWEPAKSVALKAGLLPEQWEIARFDLSSRGVLRLNDSYDVVSADGEVVDLEGFFATAYREQRPRYYAEPKAQRGQGDGAGAFTISRADAKDPRKYRAAKERAQQAGRTLQIDDQTLSRPDFDKLDSAEKMAFVRGGGRTVD
ncbi:MAG: hypothetical protein ACRD9Y_18170 [Blastocatellia bacterium]